MITASHTEIQTPPARKTSAATARPSIQARLMALFLAILTLSMLHQPCSAPRPYHAEEVVLKAEMNC